MHIFGKKKLWLCVAFLVSGLVPGVITGVAAEGVAKGGGQGPLLLASGLFARQHELVLEPQGVPSASAKTIRLRFVAEALSDKAQWSFERIEADLQALCASRGLLIGRVSAPNAERVVISIASEPTAFGESVPNVVQYFDSFLIQDGACIWEGL